MPDEILQDGFTSEDNEVVRQRKEKLTRLITEEGYNPYVNETWDRRDTLASIRERFEHLQPEEEDTSASLSTAGRVMTIRKQGKATFADLADETSKIQLYFQINTVGEKEYDFLKKWVDTGDWLGIVGHPCRTRRGELTIMVTGYKLLSKAIRPLPEKWHGLTDTEIRYR
ncbi:MAG: lysine--tRNA ligase, partial [Synergistaceae bacterium]|nr:lysine--tRNA ligase [Synergistaceae bacterium]